MDVSSKLIKIKEDIEKACERVNRLPEEVKIIAVTKYVSVERAKEALEAGILHLGENRDDGLLAKWEVLKDHAVFHYIGTLQSRKVKNIIDKVEYIHSLDRLSLAKEINKRASRKMNCFVQVNVSGEESKHGISPEEVTDFVKKLKEYPNIIVCGLMTMAPFTKDEDFIRSCFRKLRELQKKVQDLNLDHAPCNELSMGMSNDYIIAVEEGATMIRIGSALVGEES
ncbi:YggS family pyridoxal phosphate-dependent enzyme [Bacillus methanolicus]|uniref:YggS family pyridoxal phosphate-dependent enzyme n=1 Tax=Bacillus methanolicus TaxID=1471 RepID=UPI0023805268|nr:YggS family pyridoxal phosphate-dependent enzyme [Bacillus methanolicus]MDE3838441.1 YggS family pyridoxal phosphate-dependent enzyme [Bacillus methanolicus]